MMALPDLIQSGAAPDGWLFVPTAILLGALHGLEPGHSKTMMAAFIVAVRGTVRQAVLLGLAATLSHTAVVWLVGLAGVLLSRAFDATALEPYFELGAAVVMLGVGTWMLVQRWRAHHGHHHHHHTHPAAEPGADGEQDAHERKHANDIKRRFTGGPVSTGQILLFGLTGGLIPCPAALTVLLICLQLKKIGLAVGLVFCFSIGLALTMTMAGVVAALSLRHIHRRWPGLSGVAQAAPYLSGLLIIAIGLVTGAQAVKALGGF